jgi:hypothetical protein
VLCARLDWSSGEPTCFIFASKRVTVEQCTPLFTEEHRRKWAQLLALKERIAAKVTRCSPKLSAPVPGSELHKKLLPNLRERPRGRGLGALGSPAASCGFYPNAKEHWTKEKWHDE